jgi:NAD(P)-dependent dehydrogenase (short-subunit alcohol dehydrogenase family)
MDLDLTDKVTVVTGASSGIGRATALLAGAAGANVVAVGRHEGRLAAVCEQVASAGGQAHAHVGDLADVESAATIATETAARFGRIDAIVNAAGIYEERPLAEAPLDSLERQWALHVRGPYVLTQAALPHLSYGATVVFVSSTVARGGFANCAAYTATKGAVEAMGRSLAAELAPAVRVNVVAPGFVDTPMLQPASDAWPEFKPEIVRRTPLGFLGRPEDVASSIMFLSSDASRYLAGAVIVADGGWTAQAWQS